MSTALSAKNKTAFAIGALKKPNDDDPLVNAWIRCNDIVFSWFKNSLSKMVASSILYMTTAADVWKDLHERFSQSNRHKVFQLRKALSVHNQENSSVIDYFTELKSLWNELLSFKPIPACGFTSMKTLIDDHEEQYVMQFLIGLNDSYSHIRGQVLLMDLLPSINNVFSLILQEEKQRGLSNGSTQHLSTSTALVSKTSTGNSNLKGSGRRHEQPVRKDKVICNHCGYISDTVDKCYKIHGYPPGWKSNKNKLSVSGAVNQVSADRNT
ncbi:uncharacterized protein LOC122290924 [Carya illinoinensis]|uniref:uncharacterized protein LOC122290924 n=1 Tax=Carya illinoinensis TaxID=32201 RepID=UPI001C7227B5|nr:uncharacterized protein LOC122290924 [Carya illinoinensis]